MSETPDSRASEIAQRVAAATPGPWWKETADPMTRKPEPGYVVVCKDQVDSWRNHDHILALGTRADAQFIAHARSDVPWLLAERERLQGELDEAESHAGSWERAVKDRNELLASQERELSKVAQARERPQSALVNIAGSECIMVPDECPLEDPCPSCEANRALAALETEAGE